MTVPVQGMNLTDCDKRYRFNKPDHQPVIVASNTPTSGRCTTTQEASERPIVEVLETHGTTYPVCPDRLKERHNPISDGSDERHIPREGEAGSGSTSTDTLGYRTTQANLFGLKKRYYAKQLPHYDPDFALTSADIYDSPHHQNPDPDETEGPESETTGADSFAPFPNLSSFELGEWFYNQGTQKSLKDFKALVDLLTSPDFSLEDIRGTKWTRIFQDLGKNKEEMDPKRGEWVDDAGWKTTDVEIEVPVHSKMQQGRGVEKHVAGKLYHRSIVSIVEEKIRNTHDSKFFHYHGHELLWKPDPSDSSPEFRILSELYHSDAFLKAQKEVLDSPPPQIKDCQLPRVIVGLMFWSDATHVSTFSSCKLWPLYMLFANESKFRRAKSGTDLCNHVAYFDALSDSFKDYLTERTGGKIPPNLLAHLNRELAHAQWEIILDDELLNAIVMGIVIKCCDGVLRRFFIRIFTYSTDYPERVLMATIKARGDCPCVLCLVRRKDLGQMGTPQDMVFREENPRVDDKARQDSVLKAKEAIKRGLAVGGDSVMGLMPHSGVPTINAFSKRLSSTGFNIFAALTVDVLHEFEVGAFKSLFIHLIRLLDAFASGSTLVHELDRRYRSVPTFNKTIRKFSSNVSSLKRRAARDYEDVLQCAIAVFDGLLTGTVNDLVLKLLFLNARWHALAKLRMHNEATITLLEKATAQLGDQYRLFIKETSNVNTLERPREAEKRMKRAASKAQDPKERDDSQKSHHPTIPTTGNVSHGAQPTLGHVFPTLSAPRPVPISNQQIMANTDVVGAHAGQPQPPMYHAPFPIPPSNFHSGTASYASTVPAYPHYAPHREYLGSAQHPQAPPYERQIGPIRQGEYAPSSWPNSGCRMQAGMPVQQAVQHVAEPLAASRSSSQYRYAHQNLFPHQLAPGTAGGYLTPRSSFHDYTTASYAAMGQPDVSAAWQAYYGHWQAVAPSIVTGSLNSQTGVVIPPLQPVGPNQYGVVAHSEPIPRPAHMYASSASAELGSQRTSVGDSGPTTADGVPPLASAPSNPGSGTDKAVGTTSKTSTGRRSKKLNISTVKFHALGHYPKFIRYLGPSDLYSTEWGEYFHKSPKAWTKQTSRRHLRMELSRHERRRKRLQRAKYRMLSTGNSLKAQKFREQRQASRNPDIHHFIAGSQRVFVTSLDFSQRGRFASDILSLMFIRKLKQHLLPRFISMTMPHLDSASLSSIAHGGDWSLLTLKNDRIYTHQIMRIKYTTYDTRRDEDIIHLDTAQCNIMVHNPEYSHGSSPSRHPFRYCKVMAILHAEVAYMGDNARSSSQVTYHRMELLWVRWYRIHPASSEFQLDQAELMRPDEPGSHSFIDPLQVLRACHMIPRYCEGKVYADGKGRSQLAQDGSDWRRYYINRFVDRDMFMRYEWGLAVGHTYAHADSVSAIRKVLSTDSDTYNDERASQSGILPSANANQRFPDRMKEIPDEGGEDDDDDDASSINTDDSCRRAFTDSEDEREAILLGLDF